MKITGNPLMNLSTITWIPFSNAVYDDNVNYLIQYRRQDWDAEDAEIGIFWHTSKNEYNDCDEWGNDAEVISEDWIQAIAEMPDTIIY